MYWSHKNELNSTYCIESSLLDGTERQLLAITEEPAESLSFDFTSNRIYFVYKIRRGIVFYDLAKEKVIN